MRKPFLPEITYMRGLCMLGVIAIHVGSMALTNPLANVQLIGLLEILSRFSVPAFFFLSAFGLFYHTSIYDSFSYKDFLKRRIQVVLWPYIIWSVLYMIHTAITLQDFSIFHPSVLIKSLIFGTGYYHLYFMVILLWFYLFMPLWRWLVRLIEPHPVLWLAVLLLIQIGIDYWSSYVAGRVLSFSNPYIQYAFDMRLNYCVIFYVWIFLLGAMMAERYEQVMEILWRYRILLAIGFILSVTCMLGAYYYVMYVWKYTLLESVYTVHQLSPMGVVYTGVGTIFFLFLFYASPMNDGSRMFWEKIGKCSYGIYLVHPFMLLILSNMMVYLQLQYTVIHVLAIYMCTVGMSYITTLALQVLPNPVRKYVLGN